MRRAAVLLYLLLRFETIAALCGDSFADGLENMDGMMDSMPGFMQAPVNAICEKAASKAAGQLPRECSSIAKRLREPAEEKCKAVSILLLNAAKAGDCYCQAAVDFAHDVGEMRPSSTAQPPAATIGSRMPTPAAVLMAASVATALRLRSTLPTFRPQLI